MVEAIEVVLGGDATSKIAAAMKAQVSSAVRSGSALSARRGEGWVRERTQTK